MRGVRMNLETLAKLAEVSVGTVSKAFSGSKEISEDTKCMCKQFREQIANPDFEGYCHCMLYYKEK